MPEFISKILAQPVAVFFLGLVSIYAAEFVKVIAKRHAASTENMDVGESAAEAWQWMKIRRWKIFWFMVILTALVWWFFDPCNNPRTEMTGEQVRKCDARWLRLPFF